MTSTAAMPGRVGRGAHAEPRPGAVSLEDPSALRRGGRQRRVEERAEEIQTALRSAQLAAPAAVAEAMGATVAALVAVIRELNAQIAGLEESLAERFDQRRVRG